jgi:DNA-directed RNA polymerase specialized sigma24 family protein
MRKIKDVLRLKFEAGLSHERIAAAVGLSEGAVTNYVQRAGAAADFLFAGLVLGFGRSIDL